MPYAPAHGHGSVIFLPPCPETHAATMPGPCALKRPTIKLKCKFQNRKSIVKTPFPFGVKLIFLFPSTWKNFRIIAFWTTPISINEKSFDVLLCCVTLNARVLSPPGARQLEHIPVPSSQIDSGCTSSAHPPDLPYSYQCPPGVTHHTPCVQPHPFFSDRLGGGIKTPQHTQCRR